MFRLYHDARFKDSSFEIQHAVGGAQGLECVKGELEQLLLLLRDLDGLRHRKKIHGIVSQSLNSG